MIPSDVFRLFLYDEQKQLLSEEKGAIHERKASRFTPSEIPFGNGLIGGAAAEIRSVIENDAHLNPLSVFASGRPKLEHLLAVPVTHGGRFLGMIALERLRGRPFEKSDLFVLEIFASQLATALHNSRLYDNLLRSENLYRLVLNNVNDSAVLLGTDKKFLFVNPKFEDASGYKPEEVLGREFDFLIHHDDLPIIKNYYKERIDGRNAPNQYSFRFVKKNGEVRTVEYNVAAISERGKIAGLLGVARDITNSLYRINDI